MNKNILYTCKYIALPCSLQNTISCNKTQTKFSDFKSKLCINES